MPSKTNIHSFWMLLIIFTLSSFKGLTQDYFTELIPYERHPVYPSQVDKIVAMENGGWILVHFSNVEILNLVVSKFDACGDVLWSKLYGNEGKLYQVRDLLVDENDNIVILGVESIIGNPYNCFLLQLDSQGGVNYYKEFGYAMSDVPYFIDEDNDGNYIVMANQDQSPSLRVIKFSSQDGSVIWSKGYINDHIWGYGLSTKNGDILCRSGSKHFKIDSNGQLIWAKSIINSSGSTFPIEVENGYVYYVKHSSNGLLYKLDLNGDIIWQKFMPGIRSSQIMLENDSISIIGAFEGSYIVGEVTADKFGNLANEKRYTIPDFSLSRLVYAQKLNDKGILISATCIKEFEDQILLIRTDSTMTEVCHFESQINIQDSGLYLESFPITIQEVNVNINLSSPNIESMENTHFAKERICTIDVQYPRPFEKIQYYAMAVHWC